MLREGSLARLEELQDKITRLLTEAAEHDKRKDYSLAAAAYNKALTLDRDNPEILFKYGWS